MILTRAPLRLSLAGGGTDLEAYYGRHEGFVVSATIDKYFYVFLTRGPSDAVQISSSDYQRFARKRRGESSSEDPLSLAKAILEEFDVQGGISLFLSSEVPPGTGLGSSSTVAVALIKALAAFQGRVLSPAQMAELACTVEIGRLGAPIGKQDQYAAAFGGLNAMTFTREEIHVEPLRVQPGTREELERNLLLFFTGATRSSSGILTEQQAASRNDDGEAVTALHAIKQFALDSKRLLEHGLLQEFGGLLDLSWQQKRRLARGVSNPRIDELYETARRNGALGGKIAGAGGGGFLMLYCEPPSQTRVTDALEAHGLFRLDYRFESGGAMVLVDTDIGEWAMSKGLFGDGERWIPSVA